MFRIISSYQKYLVLYPCEQHGFPQESKNMSPLACGPSKRVTSVGDHLPKQSAQNKNRIGRKSTYNPRNSQQNQLSQAQLYIKPWVKHTNNFT